MNNNTPALTQYKESIAPWNQSLSEIYGLDGDDYEPDILDRDD